MHIPLTEIVHFCTSFKCATGGSPTSAASEAISFQDCTTFTLLTSHPINQELGTRNQELFFDNNAPPRLPPTPGTHFPLACTIVLFREPLQAVTPASEFYPACRPPPSERGMGVPPMNPPRREAPETVRYFMSSNSAKPRTTRVQLHHIREGPLSKKASAKPFVHRVSSALAAAQRDSGTSEEEAESQAHRPQTRTTITPHYKFDAEWPRP